MTLEWKTETPPEPHTKSVLTCGELRLAIWKDADDEQTYQHAHLSVGQFSDASHEECLKTWPREAIRLIREQLNKLEAEL